jgi:hypothetical protein
METDTEKLSDFRKALEILLENPDDFRVVAKAVEERDTKTYQAVLSKHKLIRARARLDMPLVLHENNGFYL